jgi:hypothetical protein
MNIFEFRTHVVRNDVCGAKLLTPRNLISFRGLILVRCGSWRGGARELRRGARLSRCGHRHCGVLLRTPALATGARALPREGDGRMLAHQRQQGGGADERVGVAAHKVAEEGADDHVLG